jgi:hypothetical protein
MNKKSAFTVVVKLLAKEVSKMGFSVINVPYVGKYFKADFD